MEKKINVLNKNFSDNVSANKTDTNLKISTSFENRTMENVSKIYPSYINQLIIAGSGYNENNLKDIEIEKKLEKIILISIQLSLSNHLSKKSIPNGEVDFMKNKFYWDFEEPLKEKLYEVNFEQTNLITEKNTIKVNITGTAVKMGNTFLYFIVHYKNRTVHSDIISENLSMLTLSHISAFLGLPVIEINNILNIDMTRANENNWWIVILMFASGLILFFMCWCMLFIYFNTCGQLTNYYTQNSTSTTSDNISHKKPSSLIQMPTIENELKRVDENSLVIIKESTKTNDNKDIKTQLKDKEFSKKNLFTNTSFESLTTSSINSTTVIENESSSIEDPNIILKKNNLYESNERYSSNYSSEKRDLDGNDCHLEEKMLNCNDSEKTTVDRKRPLSAKIRNPAFKDVNEFKNILNNEEKVILKPEILVNDEWNPYRPGDYIAKNFVRNTAIMVSKKNYILVKYHKNNLSEVIENNNINLMTYDKNVSPSNSIHNIKERYRRLKSVEKDVLFRYLDIIELNDVEDVSDIIEVYSTTIGIDQNCGIYELIQETSSVISDKRPYDKIIDGYILMAYKTMEDMYSEEFAHNWKLWSGVRHLCAKIPAPYHFEGMHFYKELTNICQFKYLLIIDVKKLLFYVATTLNVLQTVKPKLCAYVGVYKEIFNVNNKKDGTCSNSNINTFSIANINKKELKEDIYACRKENEIKICDNIIEKKLNDIKYVFK
uniref:Cadherin domain-containing protein n=1 Tax=Strongyloides papillosus TaxID=174720 RepID=A0A0N5BYQ0_STREA